MKKVFILIVSVVFIVGLNGCASGGDDQATTLFLVDEKGFSYADIPYKCDSMRDWSSTKNNGEFTFYPPDNCEFDFDGLDGVYGDELDDIVRIVDYTDDGKGGIPYECISFGASTTFNDGSFDYDENDECVFYL